MKGKIEMIERREAKEKDLLKQAALTQIRKGD